MNFEAFINNYQKVPIKIYPNEVESKPLVSVCVQTYQHVDYIKDCLEGILMQETDFPYEILLGEDASTDGTREICIEYAEKYPDKIRLLLHKRENNMSIGGQPTGRFNFLYNLYSAQGKYIALCEGDDYWTDPHKLQKQFELLESRPGCSFCVHNAKILNKNSEGGLFSVHLENENSEFTAKDILTSRGQFAPTASYFFNSKVIKYLPSWHQNAPVGDFLIEIYSMKLGKGIYIPETMSVFRKFSENSWSSRTLTNFKSSADFGKKQLELTSLIEKDFPEVEKKAFSFRKALHWYPVAYGSLYLGNYEEFQVAISEWQIKKKKPTLKQRFIFIFRNYPKLLRFFLFKILNPTYKFLKRIFSLH